MKLLAGVLFALFFSGNLSAVMLCDGSCELSISFPEGGELQASKALTLSFGVGGVLEPGATGTVNTNPQPADTDYTNGGTLQLNKGDSISFDVNGSIVLGEGGNIDYSAMGVNSSGELSVKAVGGAETIHIQDLELNLAQAVTLEGAKIEVAGNFTVNADLILIATTLMNNGTISLSPINEVSNCNTTPANTGLDISAGDFTTIALDRTLNCVTALNTAIISAGSINLANAGEIDVITPVSDSAVLLDIQPEPQQNSAGLVSVTGFGLLLLLRMLLWQRNFLVQNGSGLSRVLGEKNEQGQ